MKLCRRHHRSSRCCRAPRLAISLVSWAVAILVVVCSVHPRAEASFVGGVKGVRRCHDHDNTSSLYATAKKKTATTTTKKKRKTSATTTTKKKKAAATPAVAPVETFRKAEFVSSIAERTGLTKVDSAVALSAVLDTITEQVALGKRVALAGFGTFKLSARAARKGRNPMTGEEIQIKASNAPTFSASKTFKEKVNQE